MKKQEICNRSGRRNLVIQDFHFTMPTHFPPEIEDLDHTFSTTWVIDLAAYAARSITHVVENV